MSRLALLPLLIACDPALSTSLTQPSEAGLDGTVDRSGVVDAASAEMEIGRNDSGIGARGFLSFDVAAMMPDVGSMIIEEATLSVYENNFNLLPWDTMGNAALDVVQYDVLGAAAFDAPSLIDAGVASSQSNWLDVHTIDVTDAVDQFVRDGIDDQWLQFRIRFEDDADTADETLDDHHWDLNTAEATDPADSQPMISIVYRDVRR